MTYNKALFVLISTFSLFLMCDAAPPSAPRGGGNGAPRGSAPHIQQTPERQAEPRRATPAPQAQRPSGTPSMSRSDFHPNQVHRQPSNEQPRQAQKPNGSKTPAFSRDQMKQYIQQAKQHSSASPANKQTPQDAKAAFQQHRNNNQDAIKNVRDQFQHNHPNHGNWFNSHFFESHHYHAYYYHSGVNWWRAPRWTTLNVFLGGLWTVPIYYSVDGYPIDVTPEMDISPQQGPYQEYYAQEQQGIDYEWMPFGVFAAGKDANQAAYSNMFVQLAINKSGAIAGTYYNAATDQVHPLEGYVDQDTQLAMWKVSDNPNSPTMITGIYNLTEDTAPIQVHFPDDNVQDWVFIRLPE